MDLPKKGRVIAATAECDREAAVACFGTDVDAIFEHAVAERQQPGQKRDAQGLTHQSPGNASIEMRSSSDQPVKMRSPHPPPGKTVTVGALLVRGNEEDIRSLEHRASLRVNGWPGSLPAVCDMLASAVFPGHATPGQPYNSASPGCNRSRRLCRR